jgi:hypothetical protein
MKQLGGNNPAAGMAFDLLHCTNINLLLKNLICKILQGYL